MGQGEIGFGSLFLTYIKKVLHCYSKPCFFASNIRHMKAFLDMPVEILASSDLALKWVSASAFTKMSV